MKSEEYKQVYDKVSLSKEADERILRALTEEAEQICDKAAFSKEPEEWVLQASSEESGRRGRTGKYFGRAVAAAAVLVLLAGIARFSAMSAATQDVVSKLSGLIRSEPEPVEGIEYGYPKSSYEYNDDTEYLAVAPDAPKKACTMDSLEEVSEAIGLDLLKHKDAYEQEDCIQYMPDVSDSGDLNRIVIQDAYYVLGDIREPEIKFDPDQNNTMISYHEGENYHSPMEMEITIMTSNTSEEDVDTLIGEGDATIEKIEKDYMLPDSIEKEDETPSAPSQEDYLIKNLGVDAVLSSVPAVSGEAAVPAVSGNAARNKQDGEETQHLIEAYFVYEGIEYRYTGDVSAETMKEFLEGLNL